MHAVFQMEGAGMRELLRKSNPTIFEDLIAIVALYRPGPMEHIPTYIARKSGEEEVKYLHPFLKDVLWESYGIPVYQEQVMKTAQVLADYTMGEADLLRRAMGKKIPEEMATQKERFLEGAQKKGVPQDVCEKIFDQMARFAGYAFNKCHATCYALITYQTAFMKANYLPYFTAAALSYDLHSDRFWDYKCSLEEANLEFLPVDICQSDIRFCVEKNPKGQTCVRYGFSAVKGLGEGVAQMIVKEREKKQFIHPSECFQRLLLAGVGKRAIEKLIQSGALDTLEENRTFLEELFEDINKTMANVQTLDSNQPTFFEERISIINDRRENLSPPKDKAFLLKASDEILTTGLYLRYNPLKLFSSVAHKMDWRSLEDMHALGPRRSTTVIAIVRSVSVRKTREGKILTVLNVFDKSHEALFILFQEQVEQVRHFLEVGSVITVKVQVKVFNDIKRFNVQSIEKADTYIQDLSKKAIALEADLSLDVHALITILQKCKFDNGPNTLSINITGAVSIELLSGFLLSEATYAQLTDLRGVTAVKQ